MVTENLINTNEEKDHCAAVDLFFLLFVFGPKTSTSVCHVTPVRFSSMMITSLKICL